MRTTSIWRLPEVLRQTDLSRSTIYEMISRGDFPRQIKLSRRAVGWAADEVIEWINEKATGRRLVDPGSS
jgi:prophage regulatory protein